MHFFFEYVSQCSKLMLKCITVLKEFRFDIYTFSKVIHKIVSTVPYEQVYP